MGLDYSYKLFFERDACFDVLERLGQLAAPQQHTTILELPDRTVRLPFSDIMEDAPRHVRWDDPDRHWDFMLVLRFEPDEEILDYLRDRVDVEEEALRRQEAAGGLEVGFVYLSVERDVASGSGEQLVLFDFGTPGTSMSILFTESPMIRRTMVDLLRQHRGVYGLLDLEDEAELFWLRGVERDERVPTADLPLEEIERLVGGAPTTPFAPPEPLPWSDIDHIRSDVDQRAGDGAGLARPGPSWWRRVFRSR